MRRILLSLFVALLLGVSFAPRAEARAFVYFGAGGYYPYYPAYYPAYYPPPAYYYPPYAAGYAAPAPAPVAASPTPVVASGVAQSGTCREYTRTITVNGAQQPAYGTACQQPDGTWKIVQ